MTASSPHAAILEFRRRPVAGTRGGALPWAHDPSTSIPSLLAAHRAPPERQSPGIDRQRVVLSGPVSPGVLRGHVTAFFLFDIAEAIELQRVRGDIGSTVAPRLTTKPATPPYLQYQQPPLTLDGTEIGTGEVDGCRVASMSSITAWCRWPLRRRCRRRGSNCATRLPYGRTTLTWRREPSACAGVSQPASDPP
jgi:hypothetical protein